MPAPPPKENAWAKRSTSGGANEKEGPPPAAPSDKSTLKPNRCGFYHELWKYKYKTSNDEAQITRVFLFGFFCLSRSPEERVLGKGKSLHNNTSKD